jgi:hypothetical protein
VDKRRIEEIRVYTQKYRGFEEGAAKALELGRST